MDVFGLRDQLVGDYQAYVSSFINIRDHRVKQAVEGEFRAGTLWPQPLVQLNPSFEPASTIEQLVDRSLLHPECGRIFRRKGDRHDHGEVLRLHRHQEDAIHAANRGSNYVLTTGTGSGKSLAYIIPIVNRVLRNRDRTSVTAIVVYPMNALANSQEGELEKFLKFGYPDGKGPVRFAKYTGQESEEERQAIREDPPDIILTNYVMLELLLTRPEDRPLINAAMDLQFLVLDELHTYRGRQGADVALLVRRLRDLLDARNLQCVGTSATLAGGGTRVEQREEIAQAATQLFGDVVHPGDVIAETLRRSTPERSIDDPTFLQQLRGRIQQRVVIGAYSTDEFINDPLSSWIETTFGVTREPGSDRLVRSVPRSIGGDDGAAKQLAGLTGLLQEQCSQSIQQHLLDGYKNLDPVTGFPLFAFRLHQFISPGDKVYASIGGNESRHVTLYGQQYVPNDRSKVLLPLVFCRECGQEYYSVRQSIDPDTSLRVFTPRDVFDRLNDDDSEAGFLYTSESNPFPSEESETVGRVPEDWMEVRQGKPVIRTNRKAYVPRPVRVGTDGKQGENGIECHYFFAPFRFCLSCGISYSFQQRSDFGKLTSLGVEGRSTATTILNLSAIRRLRSEEALKPHARKLLSFTDNRQDASLQAGHFNDFVETGLLRAALYKAVTEAGDDGIPHEQLTQRVFDALDLPAELYSANPNARFAAADEIRRAMRDVLGYRLYRDLKQGWRVTAPNLEQVGLLKIEYLSLDELSQAEDIWETFHSALANASPEDRFKVARTLLDYMRRELAIKVDYLNSDRWDQIRMQSNQRLIPPWAIDEHETMEPASILVPRAQRGDVGRRYFTFLSARGGFGQYLRRARTLGYEDRISIPDTQLIIRQFLTALEQAQLVEPVVELDADENGDAIQGYQLLAGGIRWKAGSGEEALHDPIRVPNPPQPGGNVNRFFLDYYRHTALKTRGIEAREHTAQVPYEKREERETRFREGDLPILFCSPTMELGVDIAQLNVVNLRNVPPTPANYAQRSGRAGRSGQPALVFAYCTTGSPHDQYFFKRPELMVAGSVTPPRVELANEDLIRAHVHAVWLTETGQGLGKSLQDVLDLVGEHPSLDLLDSVRDSLRKPGTRERARVRCQRILSTIEDTLRDSDWYHDEWLDDVLNGAVQNFDRAANRWRDLYRAASEQSEHQHRVIRDASRPKQDKDRARRLRAEAESQRDLLTDVRKIGQSDFYSYRYFASEGFLPGYSFPRLPLSAFIPGQRQVRGTDEYLQRPRFLAISEFGPRSIIYHEGSRYRIHRVLLPPRDEDDLPTQSIKQCEECGYLHILFEGPGPDLCERCEAQLGHAMPSLFRLENVATRRQDRISSDEEERLRFGYEIKTGVRFPQRTDRPSWRMAAVEHNGSQLARFTYGDAATLWRINLGWARRKNKAQHGFILDLERGFWSKNEQADDDIDDPMSERKARVVPYVEDSRNTLLLEFSWDLDESVIASLQAALKSAIQVCYQLEDNELAVEPLPNVNDRRLILFYESAEGGAGVLRQLVDDPSSLERVAREALRICHFDPDSGDDLRRAPGRKEDCEAACYDCLMSYFNQRDHALLDRHLIRDLLLELADADVQASSTTTTRVDQLANLKRMAGSDLERSWLDWLNEHDLTLPTSAQRLVEACSTRPDFLYERDYQAAIYIDGPHHDYTERQERDKQNEDCLINLGYDVIRFGHRDDWAKIVRRNRRLFGDLS
jgi:ATP-dependent helicase YprA (DUF1998 family)/very-short-patch-repair endonuclease